MDITKEELVELIKSTITTMNAEPSTTEEVVVNQDNEPAKEESKEEKKTEVSTEVETSKEEPEKKDVSQSETAKAEEETPKTEPEKDAKASEKKDEPEVIKEEVLNSAPTTTVPPVSENEEWRNLKGKAFRDWCAKHAEFCRNYRGE